MILIGCAEFVYYDKNHFPCHIVCLDHVVKYKILPRPDGMDATTSQKDCVFEISLEWRHNESHGVSNHRHLDCLLKHLY